MIVYNGQGCLQQYLLAKVIDPSYGKNGQMIQLSKEASSSGYNRERGDIFHKTGTNVSAPTGQSYMLPPIKGMMDILREKGRVEIYKY